MSCDDSELAARLDVLTRVDPGELDDEILINNAAMSAAPAPQVESVLRARELAAASTSTSAALATAGVLPPLDPRTPTCRHAAAWLAGFASPDDYTPAVET